MLTHSFRATFPARSGRGNAENGGRGERSENLPSDPESPRRRVPESPRPSYVTSGTFTVKIVPLPTSLATAIVPLWASTIHRAIERPSPEPPW